MTAREIIQALNYEQFSDDYKKITEDRIKSDYRG